jgi:hypothetical protein
MHTGRSCYTPWPRQVWSGRCPHRRRTPVGIAHLRCKRSRMNCRCTRLIGMVGSRPLGTAPGRCRHQRRVRRLRCSCPACTRCLPHNEHKRPDHHRCRRGGRCWRHRARSRRQDPGPSEPGYRCPPGRSRRRPDRVRHRLNCSRIRRHSFQTRRRHRWCKGVPVPMARPRREHRLARLPPGHRAARECLLAHLAPKGSSSSPRWRRLGHRHPTYLHHRPHRCRRQRLRRTQFDRRSPARC